MPNSLCAINWLIQMFSSLMNNRCRHTWSHSGYVTIYDAVKSPAVSKFIGSEAIKIDKKEKRSWFFLNSIQNEYIRCAFNNEDHNEERYALLSILLPPKTASCMHMTLTHADRQDTASETSWTHCSSMTARCGWLWWWREWQTKMCHIRI